MATLGFGGECSIHSYVVYINIIILIGYLMKFVLKLITKNFMKILQEFELEIVIIKNVFAGAMPST